MHVLIITPTYLPTITGNAITVERIANALKKIKVKVSITTPQRYKEISKKINPDILHFFHATKSYVGKVKEPYILTFTGTDSNVQMYQKAFQKKIKEVVNNAKCITFFRRTNTKEIEKQIGITISKKIIIKPAVSLKNSSFSIRKKYDLKKETPIILLIAGIRAVKDPLYAIREYEAIHRKYPQTKLIILGEKADQKLWKQIKKETKNSSIIANIQHKHMKNVYKEADIIINTSNSEGLSNAMLEAMSLKKPILCSDVPGNEVIPKKYRFNKKKGELTKLLLKFLKKPWKPVYKYQISTPQKEAEAYKKIYHQVLKDNMI
jgi:L-malate glycosyltransferase